MGIAMVCPTVAHGTTLVENIRGTIAMDVALFCKVQIWSLAIRLAEICLVHHYHGIGIKSCLQGRRLYTDGRISLYMYTDQCVSMLGTVLSDILSTMPPRMNSVPFDLLENFYPSRHWCFLHGGSRWPFRSCIKWT